MPNSVWAVANQEDLEYRGKSEKTLMTWHAIFFGNLNLFSLNFRPSLYRYCDQVGGGRRRRSRRRRRRGSRELGGGRGGRGHAAPSAAVVFLQWSAKENVKIT